jgi:hypothetical protein
MDGRHFGYITKWEKKSLIVVAKKNQIKIFMLILFF